MNAAVKLYAPPLRLRRERGDRNVFKPRHHKFLLAMLACPDGITDEELSIFTSTGATNARTRRHELVKMGYARDTLKMRPGVGRAMTVWQLTTAGRAAARKLQRERTKR